MCMPDWSKSAGPNQLPPTPPCDDVALPGANPGDRKLHTSPPGCSGLLPFVVEHVTGKVGRSGGSCAAKQLARHRQIHLYSRKAFMKYSRAVCWAWPALCMHLSLVLVSCKNGILERPYPPSAWPEGFSFLGSMPTGQQAGGCLNI